MNDKFMGWLRLKGFLGAFNDASYEALGPPGAWGDRLFSWLLGKGLRGAADDMLHGWLVGMGYNGSINDMLSMFEPPPPVNKDALIQAIQQASEYDQDDYTPESYQVLEAAVSAGEVVRDDEGASQGQVDQATDDIITAIDNLVPAEGPVRCGVDLLPVPPDVSGGVQLPSFEVFEDQTGTYTIPPSLEDAASLSDFSSPFPVRDVPVAVGLRISAESPAKTYFGVGDFEGNGYTLVLAGQAHSPWTGVMWQAASGASTSHYYTEESPPGTVGWVVIKPDGLVDVFLGEQQVFFEGAPPEWFQPMQSFLFQALTDSHEGGEEAIGKTCTIEWITDAEDMPSGVFPYYVEDLCGNPVQ